jgi:hypothetical protein
MPQIAKKDVQAYQQSTFEKAGLMGPPTGVSIMTWSYDSRYLATKCDQLPQVTWIWDIQSVELHSVLIHLTSVKSLSFAPSSHHLIIATGSPRFHLWTPQSASVYELSSNSDLQNTMCVSKVKWNPSVSQIIL